MDDFYILVDYKGYIAFHDSNDGTGMQIEKTEYPICYIDKYTVKNRINDYLRIIKTNPEVYKISIKEKTVKNVTDEFYNEDSIKENALKKLTDIERKVLGL